ncbi:MAG: hypothetical protein QNK24_02210 [Desulfuromusa sp.]|nr:hypothetical protein [Desulfuromusa sp.]
MIHFPLKRVKKTRWIEITTLLTGSLNIRRYKRSVECSSRAGSCQLDSLQTEQLSLQRNLFSTLFIMATEAAGVALEALPFYTMINQCLRVQITGCDNLLYE